MQEISEKTTVEQFGATGRRKEAVCRVSLRVGKGDIVVNGRPKEEYFCREVLVQHAMQPLQAVEMADRFDIDASVKGGGASGQAGALRLAIARALIRFNPELRDLLKKGGYLTVDAREVERKKYGRPKARKRFQFSKR